MMLEKQVKKEFLKKYGSHVMAYSTLQPEIEDFFVEGLEGYISFGIQSSTAIVLSDPVCKEEHAQELVKQFYRYCKKNDYMIIGLQLSEKASLFFQNINFYINEFGIETDLDICSFDLTGKNKSHLRRWKNKSEKEGVSVAEKRISELNRSEIEEVSNEWLEKNHGIELIFLTRPLRLEDEGDVRYFFGIKDRKIEGFVIFDPIYQNGNIIGYYHNFVRYRKSSPNGLSDLITLKAIEQFKKEQIPMISFGLSPLYGTDDKETRHSEFLKYFFKFLYNHCNMIYPFKGNVFHKEKYHGKSKKTFVVSESRTPVRQTYDIFRKLRLV